MLRRNPTVGSSTNKRLIHPNLIVKEDARKAIGSNRILEIRTNSPNPSRDIKWRVFCHWGTSKKGSLDWKYVGEGFGLKQLLLYLSRAFRVSSDSQPTYARSTLHTQSQSCVCRLISTYAQRLVKAHVPLFWAEFFYTQAFLGFSWPNESFKTYSKYKIANIKGAKLYRNIQFIIIL